MIVSGLLEQLPKLRGLILVMLQPPTYIHNVRSMHTLGRRRSFVLLATTTGHGAELHQQSDL